MQVFQISLLASTSIVFTCSLQFSTNATNLDAGNRTGSIPLQIFVTGPWLQSNENVQRIVHNFLPAKNEESVWINKMQQQRASARFAPHAPPGTKVWYYDNDQMRQSACKISQVLEQMGAVDGACYAFLNLRPGAFRADLWRYMVLWYYGGVYLDMNLVLQTSLENWIDFKNDDMVIVDDPYSPHGGIWNAMMATKEKSTHMLNVIRKVVENIHAQYYGKCPLDITGPCAVGSVLSSVPDIRKQFEWRDFRVVDIQTKQRVIAVKDDSLHFPNPETHYDPLWKKHQIYCSQPGPPGLCDENPVFQYPVDPVLRPSWPLR